MAATGFGWSNLAVLLAQNPHLLAEGSLLPVLEDYTIEPVWSLWAVRPPGQMVPARVRAFIDFMEMKFQELEA